MEKILFKEEQRTTQLWIWSLVILTFGLWLWQFVQQIILGIPFGKNPSPDIAIYVIGIVPVGAFLVLLLIRLETTVTTEYISFRFLPFQRKPRILQKRDIRQWEVKHYQPIREYGGWGIRTGFKSKGMAYSVKGNQGAYFEMNNGKKVLIGTQDPDGLEKALEKMTAPSGQRHLQV